MSICLHKTGASLASRSFFQPHVQAMRDVYMSKNPNGASPDAKQSAFSLPNLGPKVPERFE